MGETITLSADDGHGLSAYRARPQGTPRAGPGACPGNGRGLHSVFEASG